MKTTTDPSLRPAEQTTQTYGTYLPCRFKVQSVIHSMIIILGTTTTSGYGTGTQTGQVGDTTGRYAGTYLLFF